MCRFFSTSLLLVLMLVGVSAQNVASSDSIDGTKQRNDTIYRGIGLKLDLFTPIYTMASTAVNTAVAELGVNVNLLNRYFPTIELGYGQCDHTADRGGNYNGKGFFMRAGADVGITQAPVGKLQNLFFVGLRGAMAVQDFSVTNLVVHDPYWDTSRPITYDNSRRVDAWMEGLAGLQVTMYKGFSMGWTIRYKYLFTKKDVGTAHAWYIPGFGRRADSLWGFNYYIGYSF